MLLLASILFTCASLLAGAAAQLMLREEEAAARPSPAVARWRTHRGMRDPIVQSMIRRQPQHAPG